MGRKRKNHVYAYFNYQKETNTSKCDIEDCNKLIKGNHGTNLLHHLSSKHVAQYNMVMKFNNLANDVEDKEICGEVNSAEECKSKWRNIRDNYMKNKKKKITGCATSYSKYDDERLNFLSESHDEGETSSTNVVDNVKHDPIEISFECVKEEYDSSEDVPLSESPFVMGTPSSSNADQPTTYTPTIVTTTCEASQSLAAPQNFTVLEQNVIPPIKRPMKRKIDSIIDELKKDREERNVILQQLVTKATCPTGKTPIHNFFSSMADIVCNFPPEKIAEVRMKVCSMVSDVELSLLRGRGQSGGSF